LEEGSNKKASKKKKSKTPNANAKAKMEGLESSSEVEIPPVPAKAKKIKKPKKTAKKTEVSESEDEPEIVNSSIAVPILSPSNTSTTNATTVTTESHHPMMMYSSSVPTLSINQTTYQSKNDDLLISNNSNNINNNIINNNNNSNNNSTNRGALMFNKVSQPSPLSSVSYLNYYEDQSIDNNNNNNSIGNNNKPTINPLNGSMAQSPILPIQTPTTPLFGPTTPKMESSTIYSFTNGPSLTISTAPSSIENNNNSINNSNSGNPVQEETIIDLFNRTNKSFRRPRSISLNSHFQPSNDFRSNLSPLLMSTLKNSSALKLDPSPVFPTEQYNNIKLNGMNTTGNGSIGSNVSGNVGSHTIPFQNSLNDHPDSHLYNSNNLSTSYIPPMHSKGMENNKETIPAQTLSPIKSGFNDFTNNKMDNETSPFSLTSPIIKKPTENVIQRYRRARTLSSPAVPPSIDKKNHFYSPFMTGLDIKYDFYIPKSNAVSPLSSSFTAGDSRSFEMTNNTNRGEEMTRRRSQSINERNRPNINEF